MCTAGTMVRMKSSNSNSSARCYLLECHKEWYVFIFACHILKDPFSFLLQTEGEMSSCQMGFKPSLLSSECPKGCSHQRSTATRETSWSKKWTVSSSCQTVQKKTLQREIQARPRTVFKPFWLSAVISLQVRRNVETDTRVLLFTSYS